MLDAEYVSRNPERAGDSWQFTWITSTTTWNTQRNPWNTIRDIIFSVNMCTFINLNELRGSHLVRAIEISLCKDTVLSSNSLRVEVI